MKKQRNWTVGWADRYFVLTPLHLHYFKHQPNNLFFGDRGTIPLADIVIQDGKVNEFLITTTTTGKTRLLRALSKEDKELWINHITNAQQRLFELNQSSSKIDLNSSAFII